MGLAFGLLIAVRLGLIRTEMRLGVWAVFLLAGSTNLYWWSWVRGVIRNAFKARPGPLGFIIAAAWDFYVGLMLIPVIVVAQGHRTALDSLATPLVVWGMIWHLLAAGMSALIFANFLWRQVIRLKGSGGTSPSIATDLPANAPVTPAPVTSWNNEAALMSRRGMLQGAAAIAPLVITGGTFATGYQQAGRFRVRKLTLEVPGLPERLKGLTLTQLSDFHVGRIFRPEHLPAVVDAANALKSDLVFVTGDIIDHSPDYLPSAVEAMSQLESRYGCYTVIGNHDLFRGPRQTVAYLREHEPHFLEDELAQIDIGGERLQIAGLFWSRNEDATPNDPGLTGRAEVAMAGGQRDRFTIALTHHPHAFEALAEGGANLVLAGHTHGGQLMLVPAESGFPLGAGNVLFRYIHGVYRHGNARLYVNSGVGNWFPVRVNAPAEIVQLRLV